MALLAMPLGRELSAQYRSTQWTADSGLPQNSVRGLAQTSDGFIWVATLNGLAKFDGIRFTVFDKSNTSGMSSSRFVSMVPGADDDLWLASEDNNLTRYHDGHFTTLGEGSGIRPHSVGAITSDRYGSLWVESDDHVYRWVAATQHFERERFNSDNVHFTPLWWVGTGFWATQDSNLLCFSHGQLKSYALPKELTPEQIRGVAVGADDAVWIGTHDQRLGKLVDGKYVVYHSNIVTHFLNPTRQNWTVEISQNFNRTLDFPSGGVDTGIPYNAILFDNEDNTWVGSEDGGLFRIQKQSIETISSAQGMASDNIYPVMHSRTGDIWAGSWPAGLSRMHNGKVVRIFTLKDGLPGLVTSLAEDNSGTLWVGSHNGLRVLSGNRLIPPRGLPQITLPAVQVIYQTPNGIMLFGTPKGMYVLDGAHPHWMTMQDGLATNDVRVIVGDSRGDTWIGGYGGLTRIHRGQLTRWTEAEGLPSDNVRSVMEDSAGDIWVGTYDGGIGWLRNSRWVVFNEDKGLHDNGAFQILEDAQRRFWISSNRGIYRVSRSELVDVADGQRARVDSIAYGRADGMLSIECNGGLWPAGAKDDRGFLWFPTQKGLAIVDPSSVTTVTQPPRVEIESASIEHKPQNELRHVVLNPRQSNLEIEYTALSYTKPEQISFRYMLQGIDDGWQEVGQRRTAYYSHLPPGEYLFRVSARNSDGVACIDDGTMIVTVIPPFYRRWWFLVLLFLAVLAIIWILWNYRVRQLKKTQAAQQAFARELIASQENERRRIAAELHDSLGQRLIIINNLALFLLRPKKARREEDQMQTLEEIKTEASQAIEETRAISYALRPFQLDRLGLSKAIQALTKTVARASEIEITTRVDNIDDAFDDDVRINFYRIVQEALNNIVKHSGATHASVTVKRTKSSVVLVVSDNGKGLPSDPRATAGPGGFGLTGMRERATLLQGTMHVKSEPRAGTLLTMEFPVGAKELSCAT
jgi:signal transduction histidine kinase/ligand-binding sensor domain-containing protein